MNCDKCGNYRRSSDIYECAICTNNVCVLCGDYQDSTDSLKKQWVCTATNSCSRYAKTNDYNEVKTLVEIQTRQIEWLVDELAYELVQNETQAACPADPEAIERKRLAIITDMQEIE